MDDVESTKLMIGAIRKKLDSNEQVMHSILNELGSLKRKAKSDEQKKSTETMSTDVKNELSKITFISNQLNELQKRISGFATKDDVDNVNRKTDALALSLKQSFSERMHSLLSRTNKDFDDKWNILNMKLRQLDAEINGKIDYAKELYKHDVREIENAVMKRVSHKTVVPRIKQELKAVASEESLEGLRQRLQYLNARLSRI